MRSSAPDAASGSRAAQTVTNNAELKWILILMIDLLKELEPAAGFTTGASNALMLKAARTRINCLYLRD
jgi:hypothetical protein